MKCDEGRPSCSACRDSGLTCGGYEKSIFFDSDGRNDGTGRLRFRQFILTERERQSMSELLTASVPPKSAFRYIAQIDEECEEASPSDDLHICRGPFSAFSVRKRRGGSAEADPSPDANARDERDESDCIVAQDVLMAETNAAQTFDTSDLDMPMSPLGQQSLELMLDHAQAEWGHNSLAFPEDLWDPVRGIGDAQEVFDEAIMPAIHMATLMPVEPVDIFPMTALEHPAADLLPPPSSPAAPPQSSNHSIPEHAVFLLKHYSTTVLNLLTPFRHTKTPWHILFIPHVKHCLAGLTLGEQLDHASLSAFYGTLAISALSIGGVSHSQMWLQQGKAFQQLAREHTREMLKKAYCAPKMAKYKSILMALITMVQVSMFSGNRDQTECYFLEAEKFIRLKGLVRKKSRKVRLLHHCYAFERILYESTITSEANYRHRLHVREAVESSGLVVVGQDSLQFRLSSWQDIQKEMAKIKSQHTGENDLHLEHPGIWSATLYPEIFGIPEQWLASLSLVIRLGKEKDAARNNETAGSPGLGEFLSMAKGVERVINHLPWPEQVENGLDNLLGAWQQSLQIYFYRRIYDVDASLLQHKVIKVRDCIIQCGQVDMKQIYASARLIWPAFIAASEAEGLELQQSFADWFRSSSRLSGIQIFEDTLHKLERSWQEKTSLEQ
ncbi:rginine metabolism regulation protein ii [Diaporthe amygdali]|uniref:rginine metabolism regulation protein ii n=1 Tax=Phomopsis amygdali TaxID=1214568 RepID=UPI0022FE98E2|nr:rginine metabolism regulation protein ii [Diaporthe amygdali]KAJ0122979.1 rginine metabolism regulation protein ii [Diaporthe amygdali]